MEDLFATRKKAKYKSESIAVYFCNACLRIQVILRIIFIVLKVIVFFFLSFIYTKYSQWEFWDIPFANYKENRFTENLKLNKYFQLNCVSLLFTFYFEDCAQVLTIVIWLWKNIEWMIFKANIKPYKCQTVSLKSTGWKKECTIQFFYQN